jgi:NADPH-dependent curcumin reductase CurA
MHAHRTATNYTKDVEIGEVMQGGALAKSSLSITPKWKAGDIVESMMRGHHQLRLD